MTENAERGPRHGAPFEKNVHPDGRPGGVDGRMTRVPVASAARYGPGGRRRFPLLLVLDCPYGCGCAHAHRGEAKGLRQSGCGRGDYLIAAVSA
jgi:hypothetical protein